MPLIDIVDYIEIDLMDFYFDNFEIDDLEELISYQNKCGNTKKQIIEMFSDYQIFSDAYDSYFTIFDF